jgi:SH3-like domain-containing protein
MRSFRPFVLKRNVGCAIPAPIRPRLLLWLGAVFSMAVLSGCGILAGMLPSQEEPAPTPTEVRALVPTFTPTPEGQAAAPAVPTQAPVAQVEEAPAEPAAEANPETEPDAEAGGDEATAPPQEEAPAPTETPTETPPPSPQLVVSSPSNLRSGPGTTYGLVGAASPGDTFDVIGKNPEGDWWQICCVNGQEAWLFGQLGTVQNAEAVAIAQNIPAPPPTQPPAPAPAEPAPAEPAPAEPEPAPAEPEPAPAADPCANIGGDGCKFKVSAGPQFGGNGGQELKLQLAFIHSGVDGGQAQGSYFVVLEKDGVRLPIGDNVRSEALNKRNGPLGEFNYEYSLGVSSLPGNTVAGNYTMWVLDGNGERDSQNFSFSVPEGQGLVWMVWDQA